MTAIHTLDITLPVDDIQAEPRRYRLEASEAERAELVTRFKIVGLDALSAEVQVRADAKADAIRITGHLDAVLTQRCVVTLEDVAETVSEPFELILVSPETADRFDEDELYLDPEAPDYDAFEGDTLPLGEIVAQTLSVLMNPYPKKDGAEVAVPKGAQVSVNEEPGKKPNPFAVLSKLRDKS